MRPKSLILLVLALGCGLIAAVGINQVMANRTGQGASDPGEMVPIFVALSDIGLGDPLSPQTLKLEEWPKSKVPIGALTKLEDIEGRRTRTKFYTGEPIIDAKLFAKGDQGSGATDLIPKGYRVVSVKVDAVSGSGLILPGDRVDALVHLQDSPGREVDKTSTRTFLHNVKVFAVNDVFSREDNGETAITAKTISLLVTPQQAEMVTLASEMGKIRLVMRSADDDDHEETGGVTPDELFKGALASAKPATKAAAAPTNNALDLLKMLNQPKQQAPAAVVTEPVAASPTFKMILIEGNGVREVEFADASGKISPPMQVRQISGSSSQPGPAPTSPVHAVAPSGVSEPLGTEPTPPNDPGGEPTPVDSAEPAAP